MTKNTILTFLFAALVSVLMCIGANAQTLENKGEPLDSAFIVALSIDDVEGGTIVTNNSFTGTTGMVFRYNRGFQVNIGNGGMFYLIQDLSEDGLRGVLVDLNGSVCVFFVVPLNENTTGLTLMNKTRAYSFVLKKNKPKPKAEFDRI